MTEVWNDASIYLPEKETLVLAILFSEYGKEYVLAHFNKWGIWQFQGFNWTSVEHEIGTDKITYWKQLDMELIK